MRKQWTVFLVILLWITGLGASKAQAMTIVNNSEKEIQAFVVYTLPNGYQRKLLDMVIKAQETVEFQSPNKYWKTFDVAFYDAEDKTLLLNAGKVSEKDTVTYPAKEV